MKPERFPAVPASVTVGLVAVKKYKLSFICCTGEGAVFYFAAAFFYVHDQVAVELVSGDGISGPVTVAVCRKGAEIEGAGKSAGAVDIIFRAGSNQWFLDIHGVLLSQQHKVLSVL